MVSLVGDLRRPAPTPPLPGLGTQAQLKTARAELGEAQVKLIQQQSALKELSERGEGRGHGRILQHTSAPTRDLHADPCDPDL